MMTDPVGCYSKYINAVSPWAAPHFLLPLQIPHQMWRELITNQDGRTDANTHCSSSVNPFHYSSFWPNSQQPPLVKTLAMAHCKSQGSSLTLHFSWRSWLSQASLSLPAPSWVTCFHSSTISLMRLFHKEKNEIKCQGLNQSDFMLWGTGSDWQVGMSSGLDRILLRAPPHHPHVSPLLVTTDL